jgi:hypothetical protein
MSNLTNNEIFDLEVGKYIKEYLGDYIIENIIFSPPNIADIIVNINGFSFGLNIIYLHCEDIIGDYKSNLYNDSNYVNHIILIPEFDSIFNNKSNDALIWFFRQYFNETVQWRKESELINGLKKLKLQCNDFIIKLKSEPIIKLINDTNLCFDLVDKEKNNKYDIYDYEFQAYKCLNELELQLLLN